MQCKEDNKNDFDERKDYSQVVKVRSSIERQEDNNRKDDIIETIQKKKLDIIDGDKERGTKRQQGNSILTNSKETLRKKIDIGKERNMMKKEKERYNNNDSLEKVVNKEEKDNSSKKSNSLKEEIDERLKSIERSMTYTQENGLAKLT